MAGGTENRKLWLRIVLGGVVLVLGASMLLYLVPQAPGTGETSTDAVAKVGDQSITLQDLQEKLNEISRQRQIPKVMESFYAQQLLQQMIFEKEIQYEAKRLGIRVTDQEVADRIRQFLPTAFNGDTPVGMDQYASQVQARFQLTVPAFEKLVRDALLEEKFQKLVTDGISVGPQDLQDEFRYRNEKVKLDYALIKPDDLEAKINPSEAEISAGYEKNKSRYQVPERRVVRYGLIDSIQYRQSATVSESDLNAQYQQNIAQYQVPNRVHVQHILFSTVGKTDAEVEEVRKKAEDVLKQVKKGGKFDELAKKYSEDPGSKDKGGDIGWIVQKQTVAEFEKAAFGGAKGSISDLVKTQFGFHIIKVLDKENAHTRTFDEVRASLEQPLRLTKGDREASAAADKLRAAVQQSNKVSLDDLAKEFHLTVAETRPFAAADPLLELGNSQAVKDAIFKLRLGEVSAPVTTDRGYVVLSLKDVQSAHQGTLAEVRDKVVNDLKQQKAVELARTKAEELFKRAKAGEKFDAAAKALELDPKTSDAFARNGTIPSVASGKQLASAFQMNAGEVSAPVSLGTNWVVYRVAEKQAADPADFEKQKKQLVTQVLESKRGMAFDAFRTALEARLKSEGKLKLMPEKMKGFGSLGQV